jgi:ubiquitin C-terminal hydrolase
MSISPQHKIGNLVQAIMTNPTFSEDEKSQLVEDLINEIKKEYPDLQHHATKGDVRETELRLIKEIKELDIKAEKERKEIELKLTKEIEKVRNEIKDTKFTMLKWQFIFWATQFGAIVTIGFKLLGK